MDNRVECPHCDGQGGAMVGYYVSEWSDCECCNPNGEDDHDGKVTLERLAAFDRENAERDLWCEREMRIAEFWERVGRLFGFCHICRKWSLSFLFARRCDSADYWCGRFRAVNASTTKGPK